MAENDGGSGTSWAEAFASSYEEWSADMTVDIPFYVDLARQADGPIVEPSSTSPMSLFRAVGSAR